MKRLQIAFTALYALTLNAQTVSVEEARVKAVQFLNHSNATRSLPSDVDNLWLSYTSSSGGETYFYVFNRDDDGGFVIVGGDKAAKDVLGYSDHGEFDYQSIPCNLRDLLSQYRAEISHAIRRVRSGASLVADEATRTVRADIAPLVTARWNQDYPYNCQLPALDAENSLLTGCVATAGAQIMKRYGYPARGTGHASYSRTVRNFGTKQFEANFSSTTYDWDNMLNSYDGSETEAQKRAVGTLMYHVGVGCNMKYGVDESAASEVTLATALATYFGYDKAMSVEQRSFYDSDTEWESMVYSELAAGRPVVYCGRNSNSEGHAFVCDGYADGRYHINWGWGGNFDGNYALTGTNALGPDEQGFAYDQTAVIGIQPDCGGAARIRVATFGQCAINFTSAVGGKKISVSNSTGLVFYNAGIFKTPITYGMRMKSETSPLAYDVEVETAEFDCGAGLSLVSFVVPLSAAEGTYRIVPIYKDEKGEWRESRGQSSLFPRLTILPPTAVALSSQVGVSNDGYVLKNAFCFSFSVVNPTVSAQSPRLRLNVMRHNGTRYSTIAYYYLESNFAPGEEKSYNIDQNTPTDMGRISAEGRYVLVLQDYLTLTALSDSIPFQVTAARTVTYKMTSARWGTICLPFEADIPDDIHALSITGVDDGELVMEEVEGRFRKDTPYLLYGNQGTYSFTGPITPEGIFANGALTGTTYTVQQYAPKNSYILQNQSGNVGFYRVLDDDTQRCRQYSAYLNSSVGLASSFLFNVVRGGQTSVTSVATDDSESPVFDLLGRRVGADYRGIVVVGGRKMLRP